MKIRFAWLLLAAATPVWGTDLPAFPFINVTGTAAREVAPDLAKISFLVTARDASAEIAATTVATQTQATLDLLSAAGVQPSDMDAHGVAKQVVFDRESGGLSSAARRGATPRYEVSRAFAVLLRKVASWPELGAKLLAMPNVEEVEARFDRTDRKALEAELLTAAAHDAQQQAELMAAGFAQRLGPVQAISQEPFEDISGRYLRPNLRYAYGGGGGGPTFGMSEVVVTSRRIGAEQIAVPATIPLRAAVNAIYRLEGAAH